VINSPEIEEMSLSHYASLVYRNLSLSKTHFRNNHYISGTVLVGAEKLSSEAEAIATGIVSDGIINSGEIQNLQNKINLIEENLTVQLSTKNDEIISNEFARIHNIMLNWFEMHYEGLLNEITEREKKDQNDLETVRQQVADLEALIIKIISDNVIQVSSFGFNGIIDELNADILEIEERLEAERVAAERARQQRARMTQTTRTVTRTVSSGCRVIVTQPTNSCILPRSTECPIVRWLNGTLNQASSTYCDVYLETEAPYN
jgi:hypothetical protein